MAEKAVRLVHDNGCAVTVPESKVAGLLARGFNLPAPAPTPTRSRKK